MLARSTKAICAAVVFALLALVPPSHSAGAAARGTAAARGATVAGEVKLAAAAAESRARSRGFLRPKPNPILATQPRDPRQEMIVVLEGDRGAGPQDRGERPRGADYAILGESFAWPIVAVQVAAQVDIRNRGRNTPTLYSPRDSALLPPEPLHPGSVRSLVVQRPYDTVEIRDRDSAHLVGRIVAFPHPYFSRIDEGGRFRIDGVPPGRWRVLLWYREGWVTMAPPAITVDGAKTHTVEVALPKSLRIKRPAGATRQSAESGPS